jgi:hypothetical protein
MSCHGAVPEAAAPLPAAQVLVRWIDVQRGAGSLKLY